MRSRGLSIALVMALALSFAFATQAFALGVRVENPDAAYLARTTKVDFSSLPDSVITSITAGDMKVTFDQPVNKLGWPGFGDVWGTAGEVEEITPSILGAGSPTITMQTSRSVTELGVEVTPYSWGAYDVVATFVFSEDGEPIGQVIRTIDSESSSNNWGARLFALRSDVPFDRVDVTVNDHGVYFSQVRYGDSLPATLSGTVKNGTTGAPVPFASVGIDYDGSFVTRVQADYRGRYSAKLVPGTYTLNASAPGWAQSSEDYTVPDDGATKDLTLTDHYEQAVYRFFNMKGGVHFYTANDAEFINVRKNLTDSFTYDGIAYLVESVYGADSVPLYRFYNSSRGVHFYTASQTEVKYVVDNYSDIYTYEGVAYGVRIDSVGTPVYRFYVPSRNTHFYTADTSEISLNKKLSDSYQYEGIGYWVGAPTR